MEDRKAKRKARIEGHIRNSRFFLVMLVVNLLMLGTISILFYNYTSKNKSEYYASSVETIEDSVAELSNQLSNYFSTQDMIMSSYVAFMEDEAMNEAEAVDYLSHWLAFYAQVDLVNVDTMTGVSMQGAELGGQLERDHSYKGNSVMEELCGMYRGVEDMSTVVPETGVHMTDIFELPGVADWVFAIYQPVVLMEGHYILVFTSEVSALQYSGLDRVSLSHEKGLLLNAEGEILSGTLLGLPETGHFNYFEYVEQHGKPGKSAEAKRDLTTIDHGRYEGFAGDIGRFVCVFRHIPGTRNWVYAYRESKENLISANGAYKQSIIIIQVMVLWLLIDVCGYYLYNRILKRFVEQVDERNKELQIANQAKNVFISNMSHEIRTPINAVLGMNEMIMRESDDPTIREYSMDIKNAGKMLLGTVNDILDYSKIGSGKMKIIPQDYNVGEMLLDIMSLIAGKAQEKNLEFNLNLNPHVPCMLRGDEFRIKQVITNLLTNAVKYTQTGYVALNVEYEDQGSGDIDLLISVKDTGIGIREEDMEKLFTAFERLDEQKNRGIEGTGLGMSIVTRLLEQMDSKLEVDSVYGRGSEFSFRLPQHAADMTPVGSLSEIRRRKQESVQTVTSNLKDSKATILAVDDIKTNLVVFQGLLKRTGITVDTAESGAECLEKIKNKAYDLIFLDHRMPGMDGIQTLAKIKNTEHKCKDVPVIALTANVDSGAYEMYLEYGFKDFLSKPIAWDMLEKLLLQYLSQ